MRIVHIEDSKHKQDLLKSHLKVNLVESGEALDHFVTTQSNDPGIVIVDVGMFPSKSPQEMIAAGEALADRGWKVIYWSVAVSNASIRDDCWLEDSNSESAGALAIRAAIEALKGGQDPSLARGSRKKELETALEVLYALLPIGMKWEMDSENTLTNVLELYEPAESAPALERWIIDELRRHIVGKPMNHAVDLGNSVSVLDSLLCHSAEDNGLARNWIASQETSGEATEKENQANAVPKSLDEALIQMARSRDYREWNQRLAALRDSLLWGEEARARGAAAQSA